MRTSNSRRYRLSFHGGCLFVLAAMGGLPTLADAGIIWRSDFETINAAPTTHLQSADPDAEPDPDPKTSPEPDAVDNTGSGFAFGEADQLDSAQAPYAIAPAYLYKKYGMPGVPAVPFAIDPTGAAGATAFFFADNHRAGINTELPTGNVAGLPYNLNRATTVEGYFNTAYSSVINYQTTIPVRLYSDQRTNQDGSTRLAIGLSNYQPQALPGLYDYEGFNYTGTDLVGNAGGTGFKAAWSAVASTTSQILANGAPGLSFSGINFAAPLTAPTETGSMVSYGAGSISGQTERLMKVPCDMSQEGQHLWVSCLMRKTSVSATGSESTFLLFYDNSGNLRLLIAFSSAEKVSLQVAGGTQINSTTSMVVNRTYFVLCHLITHATASDEAAVWVFDSTPTAGLSGNTVPATEAGLPAPVHKGVSGARADGWIANAGSNAILDRLRVRVDQNNNVGQIDEIRIGSTYQSVVDAAAPVGAVPDPINVLGVTYAIPGLTVAYGHTPIQANTWYHFAAVYDGSDPVAANHTLKAYLNGQEELAVNANVSAAGTAPIVIGNDRFQSEVDVRNWNGLIDEVRVYDEALAPAQMMVSGAPHTDHLIWASSFETEKGQPVAHDQQPVTGLAIEPGDDRRGFISSVDSAAPGFLGTGGYTVTPDLMRYVQFGQSGITAPTAAVDPGQQAGLAAMYFPVERSASIDTNIPSDSGNLANKVTFECLFDSWDPTLQTGTATLSRRLFSQRMNASDSRLAFGLGRSATGNPLTVFYTSSSAHQEHGEPAATTLHVFTDTLDVAPHTWHRGKLIYDGTIVRAYLDGVKRIEFTPVGMAAPSVNTMVIGNHVTSSNGSQNYGFYGLIDEAEIRDEALVCNTPFADADGDGDVDQIDFAKAQECYSGTAALAAGCECFDRPPSNGTMDQADVVAFTKCVTGPAIPWSLALTPTCLP